VKKVTPEDAPRFFELLAYANMRNGDPAASRANALRWRENAKDVTVRERADHFLQALDGSAGSVKMASSASPAPADAAVDGPPQLRHSGAPSTVLQAGRVSTGAEYPSIKGKFIELDCAAQPKVVLQTNEGKVSFLMDEPDKVTVSGLGSATIDLKCGSQKPAAVNVRYEPATAPQGELKGMVRAIEFEPEP
jgi:hypothetical protein